MDSPLTKRPLPPTPPPPPFLAGFLRLPSRPKLSQLQQQQQHRLSSCCHDNVSSSGRFFGRPLESQPTVEVAGIGAVPAILAACCDHLANHVTDEGLFRVEAPRSRLLELRRRLDAGAEIGEAIPPRDVACALKAWLRELPEPLLPPALAEELAAAAKSDSDDGTRTRDLLRRRCRPPAVSPSQLRALRHLCGFLAKVAQHSAANRMDAANLATCLGPCLLRHVGAAATAASAASASSCAASSSTTAGPPASPRDTVARLNAAAAVLVRHHRALGDVDPLASPEPPSGPLQTAEAAKRGRSGSCSGGSVGSLGSGGSFAALRAAVSRFASRSRSRSRSPGSRQQRLRRRQASFSSSPAAAAPLAMPLARTPLAASLRNLVAAAATGRRQVPLIGACQRPATAPTAPADVNPDTDAEGRRFRQFLLGRLGRRRWSPASPPLLNATSLSPASSATPPQPSPMPLPTPPTNSSSQCRPGDSRRQRLLRCRRFPGARRRHLFDDVDSPSAGLSPRDSLRALRLRGVRRQNGDGGGSGGGRRWPRFLSPSVKASLLRSEGLLAPRRMKP